MSAREDSPAPALWGPLSETPAGGDLAEAPAIARRDGPIVARFKAGPAERFGAWAEVDAWAETTRNVAVIDVGSNSIRLVLYQLDGRAIWTVYNEKVLAGLGRGVAETRRLSPEAVDAALAALRRFRAILDDAKPDQVFAGATAAARDAKDGPAFIKRIKAETGLDVRVLPGVEEARLSALGVLAGEPGAQGLVGDLGGSSLELIPLEAGQPGSGLTLPLGPFALGAPGPFDHAKIRAAAAARLGAVAKRFRRETFHAVGGAWRNIALVHMSLTDYPVRVVHEYEMNAREAMETARLVARQSKASLERIEGVSKRRAETLPYAATVLEALIEQLGVKRVRMSAYGLREGMIFDAMNPELQRLDPLIEGCAALGAREGAAEGLGPALESWLWPAWSTLEPVFGPGRDRTLLAAACRLADIGARMHPDHRADLAFDQVLRAPIPGQTHAERAFLAAALFSRYTAQAAIRPGSNAPRLLSSDRLRRARALGAALRLGCDLSGRAPALLAQASLRFSRDAVMLMAAEPCAGLLLVEQTQKRLSSLAEVLDRKPRTGIG